MKILTGMVLGMVSTGAMAGEPCMDNFTADGNFVLGKTYATYAVLPGVSPARAFDAAAEFTTAHGFVIKASSRDAGTISAMQADAYARGRSVPLNIQIQQQGSNDTRIGINYIVSGAAFSPEDAIKRHFCMTIAAAAQTAGTRSGGAPADGAAGPGQQGAAGGQPLRRPMPGFAMPTQAQLDGYRNAVLKNVTNDRTRQLAKDAAPAIAAYVEKLACVNDYSAARALNEFAAPGMQLVNQQMLTAPAMNAAYHDKSACLSVIRVHGWSMPANNALRFEAVYKADDSGQTVKVEHEAVRQPDGAWLFTK